MALGLACLDPGGRNNPSIRNISRMPEVYFSPQTSMTATALWRFGSTPSVRLRRFSRRCAAKATLPLRQRRSAGGVADKAGESGVEVARRFQEGGVAGFRE